MKRVHLLLCAFFYIILSLSYYAAAGTPAPCPNVSGRWGISGKSGPRSPTLSIKQRDCEVSGFFTGQECVFNFTGKWDSEAKTFDLKGEITDFEKCSAKVSADLKLKDSDLLLTVTHLDNPRCGLPDELSGDVLFVLKPRQSRELQSGPDTPRVRR